MHFRVHSNHHCPVHAVRYKENITPFNVFSLSNSNVFTKGQSEESGVVGLKSRLKEGLKSRTALIEAKTICFMVTLLDARYKNKFFSSDEWRVDARKRRSRRSNNLGETYVQVYLGALSQKVKDETNFKTHVHSKLDHSTHLLKKFRNLPSLEID